LLAFIQLIAAQPAAAADERQWMRASPQHGTVERCHPARDGQTIDASYVPKLKPANDINGNL